MDSLIASAARSLAAGDALGALKRVALRDDPPALALRGIAMAQLGEHPRARELLRRAARGFGVHEELARARCVVAEAEVALAMRDFGGSPRALAAASVALETHADRANALHARLIAARRLLLLGRLDDAADAIARVDARGMRGSLAAVAELITAELALRSLRIDPAQAALTRARDAAERARVPALVAEVEEARAALDRPAARRIDANGEQSLRLDEVAALLNSGALVVDACRRGLRAGSKRNRSSFETAQPAAPPQDERSAKRSSFDAARPAAPPQDERSAKRSSFEAARSAAPRQEERNVWVPLARRPVLFALVRALAEAWPADVEREALIATAFRTRRPDETHRARLRVEIGRLRALIAGLASIEATARGFVLKPRDAQDVVLLAPPIDGDAASLVALLSDGAAWSTSALALALGDSQRTVQRALVELEAAGRVRSIGQARARRWLSPPIAGFTTILLLPAALPVE